MDICHWIDFCPFFFLWISLSRSEISKGYVYQDKYEKFWVPYDLHVEMHENFLSRWALIKDVHGKILFYYKNDYQTSHSKFFSKKRISLSSNYTLIGKIDSLDQGSLMRIEVLASKFYSRDFKKVVTRYAEFHRKFSSPMQMMRLN